MTVTFATAAPATVSILIRAAAGDLRYEVQSSTDLITWSTITTYTANGTKRTEVASVPAPTGATRFFLRLRVVATP